MSGCECRVEPVLTISAVRTSGSSQGGWPPSTETQTHVIGHTIVYCSLHAAAGRLAEALREVLDDVEELAGERLAGMSTPARMFFV